MDKEKNESVERDARVIAMMSFDCLRYLSKYPADDLHLILAIALICLCEGDGISEEEAIDKLSQNWQQVRNMINAIKKYEST